MIRMDKRNIGKLVRINAPGSRYHNRIGKVGHFRGMADWRKRIPVVSVLIKNLHNDKFSGSIPIPGNRLEPLGKG